MNVKSKIHSIKKFLLSQYSLILNSIPFLAIIHIITMKLINFFLKKNNK